MRKYFRKIINPWKINDIIESICKTNKQKKEIRMAVRCFRITTALRSSQATHIYQEFHPTRRKPFYYKLFINNKKKKKVSPGKKYQDYAQLLPTSILRKKLHEG